MCKSMWLPLPTGRDRSQDTKDQVLRRMSRAPGIWGPAGCPLKAFPYILSNTTVVPAQNLCTWMSLSSGVWPWRREMKGGGGGGGHSGHFSDHLLVLESHQESSDAAAQKSSKQWHVHAKHAWTGMTPTLAQTVPLWREDGNSDWASQKGQGRLQRQAFMKANPQFLSLLSGVLCDQH